MTQGSITRVYWPFSGSFNPVSRGCFLAAALSESILPCIFLPAAVLAPGEQGMPDPAALRALLEEHRAAGGAAVGLVLSAVFGRNELFQAAPGPEQVFPRAPAYREFADRAEEMFIPLPMLLPELPGVRKGRPSDEINDEPPHGGEQSCHEQVADIPGGKILMNHEGGLHQHRRGEAEKEGEVEGFLSNTCF